MNPREREIFDTVVKGRPITKSDLGEKLLPNYSETDLISFLKTEGEKGTFDRYLGSYRWNRYQKAVMASQLTASYFRNNQSLLVRDAPELNYKVGIFYPERWGLCPTSEEYFDKALHDQSVVIVQPGLAVKFIGRLTAYCYANFSTSGGTFIKNNWYSPVNPELRSSLEDCFDAGIRNFTIDSGVWGLMRAYKQHNPFAPKLEGLIKGIPTNLQSLADSDSWNEYRLKNREEQFLR